MWREILSDILRVETFTVNRERILKLNERFLNCKLKLKRRDWKKEERKKCPFVPFLEVSKVLMSSKEIQNGRMRLWSKIIDIKSIVRVG